LADRFKLTDEERGELLPSGKQARFTNRVHWAKSYLKQAGLVSSSRRGYFVITERGRAALADPTIQINNMFLEQFEGYQDFKNRTKEVMPDSASFVLQTQKPVVEQSTPDETLREAYSKITATLASELLDRVRNAPPAFFEKLIVSLLLAMGYGGTSSEAGRVLGQSGDDGIDGVIDQDPLGVDQVYLQAKRYSEGNNISAGTIRDFYGALSLKRARKGIFVTTSAFSSAAIQTARDLHSRIVLIDGILTCYSFL
jgi:restriction system protein